MLKYKIFQCGQLDRFTQICISAQLFCYTCVCLLVVITLDYDQEAGCQIVAVQYVQKFQPVEIRPVVYDYDVIHVVTFYHVKGLVRRSENLILYVQ